MNTKEVLIKAFVAEFGDKAPCREEFYQLHRDSFAAVKAVFGSYAEFLEEVEKTTAPKVAPKVATAPKVTK